MKIITFIKNFFKSKKKKDKLKLLKKKDPFIYK